MGTIGTIANIIVGAVNEWWYVFIQLLLLIPQAYTLFYIAMWMNRDDFATRYKIGNGFLGLWITAIFVNLIILFIVIFALEEFYETDEFNDEFDRQYNQQYGGQYGYPGQQFANNTGYVPPYQGNNVNNGLYRAPPGGRRLQDGFNLQ